MGASYPALTSIIPLGNLQVPPHAVIMGGIVYYSKGAIMAINALLSLTVVDAKGKKASMPFYVKFPDNAAVSDVTGTLDALATNIDAISEGKIVSESATIYSTVPGGLKTDPVANSDVEESGLFTHPLDGLLQKSFGIDIPAFKQSLFVQGEIDMTDLDVVAYLDGIVNGITPADFYETLWSYQLTQPTKARKSFRKNG